MQATWARREAARRAGFAWAVEYIASWIRRIAGGAHVRPEPPAVVVDEGSLLARGVEDARRPGRVLPARRALRHVGHDGEPHLRAGAGRGRRVPHQRLRHALRR